MPQKKGELGCFLHVHLRYVHCAKTCHASVAPHDKMSNGRVLAVTVVIARPFGNGFPEHRRAARYFALPYRMRRRVLSDSSVRSANRCGALHCAHSYKEPRHNTPFLRKLQRQLVPTKKVPQISQ